MRGCRCGYLSKVNFIYFETCLQQNYRSGRNLAAHNWVDSNVQQGPYTINRQGARGQKNNMDDFAHQVWCRSLQFRCMRDVTRLARQSFIHCASCFIYISGVGKICDPSYSCPLFACCHDAGLLRRVSFFSCQVSHSFISSQSFHLFIHSFIQIISVYTSLQLDWVEHAVVLGDGSLHLRSWFLRCSGGVGCACAGRCYSSWLERWRSFNNPGLDIVWLGQTES